MNAWKCLVLCTVAAALLGLGCSGEEPSGRTQQAGVGGAGSSGTSGGSAGTLDPGGTGAVSGDGSGQGGMDPAGTGGDGSGAGGMGMRVFDAGDAPDRNDVMAGELCDRLSTIQCAGEAFCCDNPGRDFAACKEEMQDGCHDQLMFDAIAEDPKDGFIQQHAKEAFEEIERLASQCDPSVASFGESIAGLRGMFNGSVPAGGSCFTVNVQRREEVAKALASCLDPATSACLPDSVVLWNCAPRGGAGSHCFTDVNCTDGLFCDNPTFDIAGSNCMARKPVGTTCELPNECETLFCKGGQCVEATPQAAYCLSN